MAGVPRQASTASTQSVRTATSPMGEADQLAQLRVFLRLLLLTAFGFGVFQLSTFAIYGDRRIGLSGAILVGFGVWMVFELRRVAGRAIEPFVFRMSLAMLLVIAVHAFIQPNAGVILMLATFLPVVLVLPYLDGPRLRRLMIVAWVIAVADLAITEFTPPTSPIPPALASTYRVVSMGAVFGLALLLLWQFANRLKSTASELGGLVALSSDLARTLDSFEVGDLIARHIARSAGADECGICYWDREGNRVLTYGYYPPERRSVVDQSYDLIDYPETRRILDDQSLLVVDVKDPLADPREVAYTRSIGFEAMAMLPLVAGGRSIGVVELFSRKRATFDERRLELGRTMASEAAIALENARLYEQVRRQAFHDGLTGLANRALLQDRIAHALARRARQGTTVALLFLDLDDFKTINDRFGHPAGDQVLIEIADRLRGCLRPNDTAARLGGDEFAVLLEDLAGTETAVEVAERLIEAIRPPIHLGRSMGQVGVSIGIATSLVGGGTTPDLLRNADFAMYRAKALGKGGYAVFEPAMRETSEQHAPDRPPGGRAGAA